MHSNNCSRQSFVIIVYKSSTYNIIFHVLVFPFYSVYFHNEGIRTGISKFVLLLQFYLEEAKGRVDYQGYIFPRRRGQVVSNVSPLCSIFINAISFVLVCPPSAHGETDCSISYRKCMLLHLGKREKKIGW